MNCQEFQSHAVDLVRGEVADSELATRCWAHASGCPACAELLLAQEKLSAGLEILATRTEEVPVPDRIENVLRNEFRFHAGRVGSVAGITFPARPARPVGIASSRLAWAMAAAAALLMVVAALIAKWRRPELPSSAQLQTAGQTEHVAPSERQGTAAADTTRQKHPQAQSVKKTSPASAKRAPSRKSNSKTPPSNLLRRNPDDALASDFIWLPYGSGLPLDDGWAMVRVTVPRSDLVSLGVAGPLNSELASTETLKADVVLGEDGLARAIRFVQ